MPTLINVCGPGRSGTTMLHLMLGNAPDAFCCGEVHAWFRPFWKHHFKIECRCGADLCPIWPQIINVPEDQFHATVFKNLDVNFMIDSSKYLPWLIDTQEWARANDIKVFNLLLWKEPIDLAYSHWKRGYKPDFWRKPFLDYYGKVISIGLPFISVSFKDLRSNPPGKLADICSLVGMPYFEGKERFWEKNHHYLFGSLGTYKQVKAKTSEIQARKIYHPEFQINIDNQLRKAEKDAKIREILTVLQSAEVSSIDQDYLQKIDLPLSKPYPLWYYINKIKRRLQGYFPRNFTPPAQRE